MTLISAYIELFVREEKSGAKCPGENDWIPTNRELFSGSCTTDQMILAKGI